MKTAVNVPKPMLADITLSLLQIAYDEFVLFCEEPAVKGVPINYERLQIRECINGIYRTLKNRMVKRMGPEGEMHYRSMMDRVADFADSVQPLMEKAHAEYRAAIVQSMPWQWQMPLIHGALSFYFMYNAQEAATMLGGRPSQPLAEILSLLDGITVRYDMPEWKPLQDSLRREWVQPVIDAAIAHSAGDFMRPDTSPVPVRKAADASGIGQSLDALAAGMGICKTQTQTIKTH